MSSHEAAHRATPPLSDVLQSTHLDTSFKLSHFNEEPSIRPKGSLQSPYQIAKSEVNSPFEAIFAASPLRASVTRSIENAGTPRRSSESPLSMLYRPAELEAKADIKSPGDRETLV